MDTTRLDRVRRRCSRPDRFAYTTQCFPQCLPYDGFLVMAASILVALAAGEVAGNGFDQFLPIETTGSKHSQTVRTDPAPIDGEKLPHWVLRQK